jgi:hypothetical protein
MNPGDFYVKYQCDFNVINRYKKKGRRGAFCSFSRLKEDLPMAPLLCNKILHQRAKIDTYPRMVIFHLHPENIRGCNILLQVPD